MQYFVTYLVYLAVLARAAGWNLDAWPIPLPVWVMLGIFGALLFSERLITRHFPWYSRPYTFIQSVLVIAMMYTSPKLDILSMLFMPLSFQAVNFFPGRGGFIWIGVYCLAMLGLYPLGMEVKPWVTMLLGAGGSSLVMGSFAVLMRRTGERQRQNQQLLADLQEAYRRLKDSSAQAEALAMVEERHRLVRELHDSLTQTLFSMNLAVQAAQLSALETPHRVDEHLIRLQVLSRSAAGEVQALTGQAPLRQPVSAGLEAALHCLAEERLAQDGLQVTLEVVGQKDLPASTQAALYRIAQEALNNVTRHAGVRSARVQLCLEDSRASLEVSDSGCGFDAQSTGRSGYGLTGMAGRAAEIGWRFTVDSQPGCGTTIRVKEQV